MYPANVFLGIICKHRHNKTTESKGSQSSGLRASCTFKLYARQKIVENAKSDFTLIWELGREHETTSRELRTEKQQHMNQIPYHKTRQKQMKFYPKLNIIYLFIEKNHNKDASKQSSRLRIRNRKRFKNKPQKIRGGIMTNLTTSQPPTSYLFTLRFLHLIFAFAYV